MSILRLEVLGFIHSRVMSNTTYIHGARCSFSRRTCILYSTEFIQSTLVISTSLILNNRLSRSEILVPLLTWKSNNRVIKYCGKEEKLLLRSNFTSFPQYFQYISNFRSQIIYSFVKCGFRFIFPSILQIWNLICRYTDTSKYFRESPGLWDNGSRMYMMCKAWKWSIGAGGDSIPLKGVPVSKFFCLLFPL